jgi:hypothetical protein
MNGPVKREGPSEEGPSLIARTGWVRARAQATIPLARGIQEKDSALETIRCRACGTPLADPYSKGSRRRGRPRKYCDDACRKSAERAARRKRRAAEKGGAETKVMLVLNDERLRVRWHVLRRKYELLLNDVAASYDLPAELRGTDLLVVEEADGRLAYRPANVVNTLMWDALAELVHDYDDDEITGKMVRRRVKARLADAIRHSDEFVRLEVRRPDGTTERVVRRKSFAVDLADADSWINSGAPVVEGEVIELLDRGAAVRRLTGDERTAYLALVLSILPPNTLEQMVYADVVRDHWDELLDAFAWSIMIGPDEPGSGGLVEPVGFFGPDGRHRTRREVRALLESALKRIETLTGQTSDEIVSGVGQRPRGDLSGLLEVWPGGVERGAEAAELG